MKPMMGKRKPDVIDALMSEPMDDDEEMPEEDGGSEIAVMAFPDDDEAEEAAPEEGTPQATIAEIRKGLDELEMMFS